MSSLTRTGTSFEELPDEILLCICRYLSSTQIVFSFHGLNVRLSQTINGYCQHIVLAQIPFKRFNSICTSILPNIGANICSLVVSNDWKGVLSKIFLNYFSERMSIVFPRLKRLILTTFLLDSLMSFLDCLQNLPELYELKIVSLYEMGISLTSREVLLPKIFTANNHRLTSISIDDDSLSFSYETRMDINYPHMKKLVIELASLNDLHRLLTDLSQLQFIDVAINEEVFELDKDTQCSPAITLTYFRLRSIFHSWTLKELVSIFIRIPNVQQLILQISTRYDSRLLNGEQMYSHLSVLSLKNFTYCLHFAELFFSDTKEILTSWKQFPQEFICIKCDDDSSLVLYSLPFDCSYVILRNSLAKNQIFTNDFARQVKCLTLYDVSPRIAETYSILTKCHRMQCLNLQMNQEIVPGPFQETQLGKLPYLTFFVALQPLAINTDDFKKLLEASPNLYHLAIDYEVINPLFDSECVCDLLGRRITDLLIGMTSIMSVELIDIFLSRLSSTCSSLKHLYFHIRTNNESAEPLILTVLRQMSKWNRLISFGVANIKIDSNILTKGIREWVLDNSALDANDSFLTDYNTDTFRLWL